MRKKKDDSMVFLVTVRPAAINIRTWYVIGHDGFGLTIKTRFSTIKNPPNWNWFSTFDRAKRELIRTIKADIEQKSKALTRARKLKSAAPMHKRRKK